MTNATCTVDACERKHVARGLCQTHYVAARRSGMKAGPAGHILARPAAGATSADCRVCGPDAPITWIAFESKAVCVVAKQIANEAARTYRQNLTPEAKARKRAYHRQYAKKNARRYKFGLSIADLEALLDQIGHACEICQASITLQTLNVDHDHKCCPQGPKTCGKCIRGILCVRCNTGLGALGDDAEGLRKALAYLTRPSRAA